MVLRSTTAGGVSVCLCVSWPGGNGGGRGGVVVVVALVVVVRVETVVLSVTVSESVYTLPAPCYIDDHHVLPGVIFAGWDTVL